jgi:hypothetical protein
MMAVRRKKSRELLKPPITYSNKEGRVYESDEEKPPRQQRSKADEALAPSVWMAKNRGVLSLARQCHRVSRKLNHALAAVTFLDKRIRDCMHRWKEKQLPYLRL